MPCKETDCKCEATKTELVAAGLDGIFGHDKDGNCKNSACGHPVLNHTDASAAGNLSQLAIFSNRLKKVNMTMTEQEAAWLSSKPYLLFRVESCSDEDILRIWQLTQNYLQAYLMTETQNRLFLQCGYNVNGPPEYAGQGIHPVQLAWKDGSAFVFKTYDSAKKAWEAYKLAIALHYDTVCPHLCRPTEVLELLDIESDRMAVHQLGFGLGQLTGRTNRAILVMPHYGTPVVITNARQRASMEILRKVAVGVGIALISVHLSEHCFVDVKPDHMIITADGRIVLVDTDSAVRLDAHAITEGFTRAYCPEYKINERPSEIFDLRCLGHSLYQLATGNQPNATRADYSLPKYIPMRAIYGSTFSASTSAEFLLKLFADFFPSCSRACELEQKLKQRQQERQAELRQAELRQAELRQAELRQAELQQAELQQAQKEHEQGRCGCWFRPLGIKEVQSLQELCVTVFRRFPVEIPNDSLYRIFWFLSGVDMLRFLHSILRIQYFNRQAKAKSYAT